ncbi:uncharacterized protein ACMZJ9_011699 [Mantella aurantiaca]
MALFNMIGSIFQPSEMRSNYTPVQYSTKENTSGRAQKSKLSKSDIGTPNNFKHITHVGFSSMTGLNLDSDVDMKALINLAGLQEEHLDEKSHRIFDVLKKEGAMEHVQKMKTRRMTTVEKPNARTRLRSLSSSSITPFKRRMSPTEQSPHATKTATALPDQTPFNYAPSISPYYSAKSSSHFPSMKAPPPMPPYLKELSQTFSCNPSVHTQSKDVLVLPPHPQFQYGRHSKNIACHPSSSINKENPSAMATSIPTSNANNHPAENGSLLHPKHPLPQFEKDLTTPLFPISKNEYSVKKYEAVPPLPASTSPAKGVYSETVISSSLCSEPLMSTEFACGTVPPAPSLPFKLQLGNRTRQSSDELVLCKALDSSMNAQVDDLNNDSASEELVISSKIPGQQNEPTLFLDQIRQGVQLKSISQNPKAESLECSSIVSALREVIQRRHTALHSSDDDEDEDWED